MRGRKAFTDAQVGHRLRQARLLIGATREELGIVMSVSEATVQRYETGAKRMTPERFAAAVVFLGFPMAWYFRDDQGSAL